MPARVLDLLHRYRGWLLGAWLMHAVALHALFIGVPSWDGFTYHYPPAIELVQHGSLGLDKFWVFPFQGLVPVAELVHVPLLAVLGLPSLLITGPLIVFPLCVVGVYKLGRKLTGSVHGGNLAGLAYAAIPVINQQPFAGYVDYIVTAALAYLIYGLLELRDTSRPYRAAIRIVVAMAIVTLTKSSGLYVAGALCAPLLVVLWREGMPRRLLGVAVAALAVGALPALTIQILKTIHYGSPIYPFQLTILGIKIGPGVPAKEMFRQSGLADETWFEMGRNFIAGWIWPPGRPFSFYDSRSLGGGWVLVIAVGLLPAFLRSASRFEKLLVICCVLVSVAARDFWYPRWSFSLTVAICVVVARAIPELARGGRGRWQFWLAGGLVVLHFLRPAYDLSQLQQPGGIGPRIDLIGSPWFRWGPAAIAPMEDLHARFVIVDYTQDGFLLPLYGRHLTNEVLFTIPRSQLGPRCDAMRFLVARDPTAVWVDDLDLTAECERRCAIPSQWGPCRGWSLFASP
ncbi:hypothetical protein BH11MYX3_BH11MYX3_34010 [soil metagenome]